MVMNPFIMAGIIVGLNWGAYGVAVGYTFASLINGYVNFSYAGGLVGLTYSRLMYNLSGILICASSMSGLVYIFGLLLPSGWSHWLRLLTQVPVGAALYVGFVHIFGVQAYQELINLMMEQWDDRIQLKTES
jgi:PST family polysaccharide transporter